MKNINSRSNSRGFAVGPVLVVVALIAIIGAAFTLSNRGTTSNTVNEVAKVNAGVISQQASSLKGAIERFIADGADLTKIELTSTPSTAGQVSLFDPVKGYGVAQQPPRSAGTGTWAMLTYTLPGVGTAGAADNVIVLTGVAKETCQRLLTSIHNIDPLVLPGLFGTLATTTVTAGTGTPNAAGMHEGCVATSATPLQNDYAFYSVIKAN